MKRCNAKLFCRLRHPMKRIGVAWLGVILAATAPAQNPNSIVFSKHNLSTSSPGTVHSTTETEICIFCHTPHQASNEGPLWNHKMAAGPYTPYSSATLKATVGQPTGSSRLCLSCHDGTVALGMVNSRVGGIPMNTTTMPAGANNLGTDLSADHPVSFTYDLPLANADGNLKDPATLPQEIRLDHANQMQCTACHDPHNNQFGNFMVMDNTGSALCLSCHILPDWSGSAHAMSLKPLPAKLKTLITAEGGAAKQRSAGKTVNVASAGCESCHVSHAAGAKKELMRFAAVENNCLTCHGGEGPGQNIAADINKISAHPGFVEWRHAQCPGGPGQSADASRHLRGLSQPARLAQHARQCGKITRLFERCGRRELRRRQDAHDHARGGIVLPLSRRQRPARAIARFASGSRDEYASRVQSRQCVVSSDRSHWKKFRHAQPDLAAHEREHDELHRLP